MNRFGIEFVVKHKGYKYKKSAPIDAKTCADAVRHLLRITQAELEAVDGDKTTAAQISIKIFRYSDRESAP